MSTAREELEKLRQKKIKQKEVETTTITPSLIAKQQPIEESLLPITQEQALEAQKFTPISPVPAPGTVPPGVYELLQGRDPSVFPTAEKIGTAVTEELGSAGVPAPISAGAGLFFTELPEIGLSLAPLSQAPMRAKALQRALSPKTIGKEIGALESKVGIEQLAGSKRRVATALGLPETAEVGDVINAVNTIAKEGKTLAPQLAKDLRVFFKETLPTLSKKTTTRALGELANSFAESVLNTSVLGRTPLAKEYTQALHNKEMLQAIISGAGKGAKAIKKGLWPIALGAFGWKGAQMLGEGYQ